MTTVIPIEIIEKKILLIRGEKVMLDSDLEEPYGAYPRQRRHRAKGRSIWFVHPQAK
jgi:hypothetical protein